VDSLNLHIPSPLVEVHDKLLQAREVRLYLKRDDLIHPNLNGNKWRKLKYNLEEARRTGASTLLTFGGAYSNHIRSSCRWSLLRIQDDRDYSRRGASTP
jgi:1-aminocyclopropane-1-carboxylate deaminase